MKIVFEVQEPLSKSEEDVIRKALSDIHIQIANLLAWGFEIEMVRESAQPPAMGNVRLVVRVWRKR